MSRDSGRGGKVINAIKNPFESMMEGDGREGYEETGAVVRAKVHIGTARWLKEQAEASHQARGNGLAMRLYARVVSYEYQDGLHVPTVEILEGQDLQTLIAHNGRLPPSAVLSIAKQLATILKDASLLAVFPSLCPRNILVTPVGDRWVVNVLEFGAKTLLNTERYDLSRERDTVLDLQPYDPPERIATGAVNVNDRSYVWSLGLIVFYALVGRCFWLGESLEKVKGEVMAESRPRATERARMFGVSLPIVFDGWFAKCVALVNGRYETPAHAVSALANMKDFSDASVLSSDVGARGAIHAPSDPTTYTPAPPFQRSSWDGPPLLTHTAVLQPQSPAIPPIFGESAAPRAVPTASAEPPAPPFTEPLASTPVNFVTAEPPVMGYAPRGRPSPAAPPSPIAIAHSFELTGHDFPVVALAIGKNGQEIFSGDKGGNIFGWDLSTRTVMKRFDHHEGEITALAVIPQEKLLLSGAHDGSIVVWDIDLLRPKVVALKDGPRVTGLTSSADGARVLVAREDGSICILSGPAWEEDVRYLDPVRVGRSENVPLCGVVGGRSGRQFYAAATDGQLHVWDGAPPSLRRSLKIHTRALRALDLLNDKQVITSSADRVIRVVNVLTGHADHSLTGVHEEDVTSVTACPGGRHLLSSDTAGMAVLWSLESGRSMRRFEGKHGPLWDLALVPERNLLLGACQGRTIVGWNDAMPVS